MIRYDVDADQYVAGTMPQKWWRQRFGSPDSSGDCVTPASYEVVARTVFVRLGPPSHHYTAEFTLDEETIRALYATLPPEVSP